MASGWIIYRAGEDELSGKFKVGHRDVTLALRPRSVSGLMSSPPPQDGAPLSTLTPKSWAAWLCQEFPRYFPCQKLGSLSTGKQTASSWKGSSENEVESVLLAVKSKDKRITFFLCCWHFLSLVQGQTGFIISCEKILCQQYHLIAPKPRQALKFKMNQL